ncbi:disintegrin and metalloproteinase domain-containing protein 33-like [Scyliorhinus torazame]|uniref:disintegrin and metalloproteinase domain-containing protein 33-like n=1 Tax=Scyliorhinus torazame TaxID=75743 RepID=UPI003B5AB35B
MPAAALLILGFWVRSAGGAETPPDVPRGYRFVPYWIGRDQSVRMMEAGEQVSYPVRGTVSVSLRERELILEIERNDQLYSSQYAETHYAVGGTAVTLTPNHTEHCVYQGHVRGYQASWLAVSLCSGLRVN